MAICTKDFVELIVRPSLLFMGFGGLAAEQMLIGTACVESQMGYDLRQIDGPAIGIYQMQPGDYEDIHKNYLSHQSAIRTRLFNACGMVQFSATAIPPSDFMTYNLKYATIMARLHYFRVKQPLPAPGDVSGQATYWKTYYNTISGKGDESAYKQNWERFAKKYYNPESNITT